MSDRYFLDTNIFVYTFDERYERKMAIAKELIRNSLDNRTAAISYQVIQEFYNAMFKRFPAAQTSQDCELFLVNVFEPMLAVESSLALFNQALAVHHRYKLSWYDSLIVAAALKAECTTLYTEDLQHGQHFGDLVITNPFL